MRTLRALVIGFLSALAGMIVGFVVYMLGGAPEGADAWQTWMWIPCYIIPGGMGVWGLWWGWSSGAEYAIGYEKPED